MPDEKPFEGNVLDAFVYGSIIVARLGNYKLLGIDVETGAIIWEDEKPWYHKWGAANGKLYLLYHTMPDYQRYIIQDMRSGQVEGDFDVSGEAPQKEVYLSSVCIHENYFLFTNQFDPKIFILDLHTGKLLKMQKIENARGVPSDGPTVQGNRIYQLDIDNVLHVFELDKV